MVAIREAKRAALKAGQGLAAARSQTSKTLMEELIDHKPLMMEQLHG